MNEESHGAASLPVDTARRKFLKFLIGIITAVIGLILGIPFISALVSRIQSREQKWYRVSEVNSLPLGQPTRVNFLVEKEDAYRLETVLYSAWALRRSSSELTVYSPICTHLGCYYNWNPQSGHFECPCHGSVFSASGKVLGGPAPRPLDTLPTRIESGVLFVKWQEFKVGVPEKIVV